jgi:hypothetical protein
MHRGSMTRRHSSVCVDVPSCSCFTSVLFTFAAVVLFVVALATPAIISTTGFGPIKTDKLSADVGPFRVVYRVGDESDSETINSDCEFTVTLVGGLNSLLGATAHTKADLQAAITQDVPVVDDCKSFNAARGFLVLAGSSNISECDASSSRVAIAVGCS